MLFHCFELLTKLKTNETLETKMVNEGKLLKYLSIPAVLCCDVGKQIRLNIIFISRFYQG